jgi:hypothetical protein
MAVHDDGIQVITWQRLNNDLKLVSVLDDTSLPNRAKSAVSQCCLISKDYIRPVYN